MESAIERAVSSEISEARLRPDYSNIALMHGFLWSWAGKRLQRPEWIRGGRQFSEEVYRLFNQHGNFEEYNSPTYYGVDMYALSLWRNYGPEPWFVKSGSDMERPTVDRHRFVLSRWLEKRLPAPLEVAPHGTDMQTT